MKIWVVAHAHTFGGADRGVLELGKILRARNIDVHVLAPWWGPLTSALKAAHIPYTVLPYRWWAGPKKENRIIGWLSRTSINIVMLPWITLRILAWRPDIIYSNSSVVCIGLFAARLLGIPHVHQILEFGDRDHDLKYDIGKHRALKLINRWSAAVTICSHAVANSIKNDIPSEKQTVIYQAIDYLTHTPVSSSYLSQKPVRCLLAATIQPGKGQMDAIQAMQLLRQADVDAALQIVGGIADREYNDQLHATAQQLHIEDAIEWVGPVDEIFPYVTKAHVVLICSRAEALGRVAVEAMKMGRVVIGTKSAGTLEVIQPHQTGFLYTPQKSAELAQRIIEAIKDPERSAAIAKTAQHWALKNFGLERLGDEMLSVFSTILSKSN